MLDAFLRSPAAVDSCQPIFTAYGSRSAPHRRLVANCSPSIVQTTYWKMLRLLSNNSQHSHPLFRSTNPLPTTTSLEPYLFCCCAANVRANGSPRESSTLFGPRRSFPKSSHQDIENELNFALDSNPLDLLTESVDFDRFVSPAHCTLSILGIPEKRS